MVEVETPFAARVRAIVAEKHLLGHPFYVAWTNGTLSRADLKEYAEQYYQHVLAEPTYLSAIHARTPHFFSDGKPADIGVRQEILKNLVSEELGEKNHPALWRQFAHALGATDAELAATKPFESTEALIGAFRRFCGEQPFYVGLAAMHAFESQVPAIAAAKIAGLVKWYGITEPAAHEFFSVHQEADIWHSEAEWSLIERFADTPEKQQQVADATRSVCDALWSFLDGVYTGPVPVRSA